MVDLDSIKALTFDVGGTVFDWHNSIVEELGLICNSRGVQIDKARFANRWRREMFEQLAEVRSGKLNWMNADQIHREVLDSMCSDYPELGLNSSDKDDLNKVWHRLKIWPDAGDAIERLRTRYTVIVLTVLSWSIAVDSSKAGGIDWDGILSCEFLGYYKPEANAYRKGLGLLGLQPHEAIMVAGHYGDLRAAMSAGLYSAFVSRPEERGQGDLTEADPQNDFHFNASDFTDLANQLLK